MPTDAPARTMRIAHAALRRDIARSRWILDAPYGPRRLAAVGRRLVRIADELEHHHEGEDTGVWPELLRLDPGLAELHARMEADHEGIHEPLERLREVGARLAQSAASRHEALAALDALVDATYDHLAAEETDAMPPAGELLSEQEWDDLAYRAWAAALTPPQKAANGLWIIDGQYPVDVRFFLKGVPMPVQLALRAIFGPGYALEKARLWGGTPAAVIPALPLGADPAPRRRPLGFTPTGDVSAWVPATPDQVYAVVSDPTRVGEWSHDAVAGRWVDGATRAAPGARFAGRSRVGRLAWSVPCVVDVADGRTYVFRTTARGGSTQWRYDLTPADGGTLVRQRFRVLTFWRPREILLRLLSPSHGDRSDALRGDLVRLGEVAAR